jgi:hypothetical protein
MAHLVVIVPIALPLKAVTCAPATRKSETPGGKRWTVWLAATNMNARGAESSSRDPREKRVTKGRIGPVGLFDLAYQPDFGECRS